jgi:hypothetical protein
MVKLLTRAPAGLHVEPWRQTAFGGDPKMWGGVGGDLSLDARGCGALRTALGQAGTGVLWRRRRGRVGSYANSMVYNN